GRHGLGDRAAVFDAVVPKPLSIRRLEDLLEDLAIEPVTAHDGAFIDREIAADLRGSVGADGRDLLDRYLGRVADELPSQLAETKRALDRGDGAEAARTLHSLVALLAVVGARAAAERGRAILDRLGRGERGPALNDALDGLASTFEASKRELESYRPE